jgi:GNAT superfamily N-acetyltransferase
MHDIHSAPFSAPPRAAGLGPEQSGLLDNPIWNALRTEHAAIALGNERARRYPSHIGPLSGIPNQAPESYAALGSLAPDDIVALFSLEPFCAPESWTPLRTLKVAQMVRLTAPEPANDEREQSSDDFRRLTADDAPAMLELATLTEPGPFRLRTLELGGFYGAFESGRLLAMAGKRMHLPGLIEVSAVCTHPDARGRGYAQRLMSRVIEEIEQEGKTAFLHVVPENEQAIRVYERLGFTYRTTFHCAVLKPQV